MNRTANRFGKAAGAVDPAKAGKDSSHGKAMVTPAPRRTARRDMRLTEFGVRLGILITFLWHLYVACGVYDSFVQELRAYDNCFHQSIKAISIRGEPGSHALNHRFVGEQQRSAESV